MVYPNPKAYTLNPKPCSKQVVETAHPYETADHSFTRRVTVDTEGGLGFRVQSSGFRVQGLGFRV